MANNDVSRMYEWYNWFFGDEEPVDPNQPWLAGDQGADFSRWLNENFQGQVPPQDRYPDLYRLYQQEQQGIGTLR